MKYLTVLLLLFPVASFGIVEASPSNWTGKYAPCNHHSELLSPQHMNLGVRISTSNALLAQQFERALAFWTGVLDLDWHEVNSQDCAIQLVDGTPSLFNFCKCLSARSQLPDRPQFQGWVAFNPRLKLTKQEMFIDSVHEIGHLLGLPHNPSDSSVMFYFGLDKAAWLDTVDLDELAARHHLRAGISSGKSEIRVAVPHAGWMRPLQFWRGFPFSHSGSANEDRGTAE